MKRIILFGTMSIMAGSLLGADSNPKDDLTAAAKQLGEKSNYSWKTTVATEGGGGGGGRFRPGPTEGKTEKEGATYLSMTRGDNTIEAVLKGGKGALKMDEGWKSLEEATADDGGQPGPGRFVGRMLQNYKTPAAEAADIVGKMKDVKVSDGVYSGELTEAGAKQLLVPFRGRGGGNGPDVSGAKGTAKFWVKDGTLSKFEYHVEGTVSFNGNDRDVNRTTTTEIKDVGTTKVTVPEEAAKKLS
ncbi:exported hypothetical protein [Verrucomicrobia bacterium]|nr:exported hypothetical protein [Verrucomicrobiota bacterium]